MKFLPVMKRGARTSCAHIAGTNRYWTTRRLLNLLQFPSPRMTLAGQCTHYERAPCLRRQSASGTDACGGFAPTPPGFSALVPLPIGSFTGQIAEGGRCSIPLYRSRPLSRRSGCFPAWPYPPLSSVLIVLRLRKAGVFAVGSGSMTLDLGGSGPSEESLSPQGGTQHAE